MSQLTIGSVTIGEYSYPFQYEEETEKITVFLGARTVTVPENIDMIVGQKLGMLTGGNILYKLGIPLSNDCMAVEGAEVKYVSLANQMRSVEYFIEDYQANSSYTEMRLQFPELDYFIPSASIATVSNEEIIFSRIKNNLCSFEIKYCGTVVSVSFDIKMICHSSNKTTAETISEVSIKFPETKDFEYLLNLYFSAKAFFSFICNRQNIGLRSATLIGKYPAKALEDKKMVDVDKYTQQKIFFSQKYLEPLENENSVKKTPRIGLFYPKIKELFQLFFEEKAGDGAILDGGSTHPSFKYRNLIDLEQSLHITAAFEYYVRTILPEISSPDTIAFFSDMESLVDEYIKTAKGKKKEKAKSFKKSLIPQVSLKEKIKKSYGGYSTWQPLKPILEEWFGDDVDNLASAANLWRNELAHEKREYQPNVDVITAVRLVEHLSYCIVLRYAGYNDEQIKAILSDILTR